MKKAQVGFIIGVVGFFAAILVVSILMSPMLEVIEVGVNATVNETHANLMTTLFNIYPVMLLLVLLIMLFAIAQLR